jgi:hypothetical protein
MQKTFRCLKYDILLMRKRCIERQNIDKDDFDKEMNFPGCTRTCAQGRKNLKALGGKNYLNKIKCNEPGCNKIVRKLNKCSACYQKKYYRKGKEMEKSKKALKEEGEMVEIRDPDTKNTTDEGLKEVFDVGQALIETPVTSSDEIKTKPLDGIITIDLTEYPELKTYIENDAKRDFRTVPMQILYKLQCSFYKKTRKPSKTS